MQYEVSDIYTIGQFSKICQVTTKALRHYDEIGLLQPSRVDAQTAYRYYSHKQAEQLLRIKLLKELGFSLEDIQRLLGQAMDNNRLMAILAEQKFSLEKQLTEQKQKLHSIELAISGLSSGQNLLQDRSLDRPQLKKLPALHVIARREVIPYAKLGVLFGELMDFAKEERIQQIGPACLISHETEYQPEGADLEVCLPVAELVKGKAKINSKVLPSCQVVWMLHIGPYEQVGGIYAELLKYITANNLTVAAPSREVYLVGPMGVSPDKYVTEIQFPILPGNE